MRTRRRRWFWPVAAIAAIVCAMLQPTSIATAAVPIVDRIAGADRYETSALISARSFAPGVSIAYVTSGLNFPDALAVSAAAATRSAPVLLTHTTALPAVISQELGRLNPKQIIVLGGDDTVSSAVEESLAAYTTGSVSRLAGADRYATSAAISAATFAAGAEVAFLTNGLNFPDALSVGPVAGGRGPILLTDPTVLPEAVHQELLRVRPSRIVVLGDTNSVSAAVVDRVAALGVPVDRIAGPDRYATSAAISAASFAPGVPVVYVASGRTFPDALSGGAATRGAPVLLTDPGVLPAVIGEELARLRPARIVILGGSPSVSPDVQARLSIVASDLPPATGARLTKATEVPAGGCLPSSDSSHRLCVGTSGGFGVYRGDVALWTSGTSHRALRALRLRDDGSVILYGMDGQVVWESGTPGTAATELVVQNDGDVVLRGTSGTVLWSSLTSATAPRWALPFASGQSWSAGGPHGPSISAGARGSLDFGPRPGGDTRVLTIADGTVFQVTCGTASYLGVRHAGGWESTYYHLVNERRQLIGTFVPAGTHLGDVGRTLPCGGGATFDHVHLSIRHAGTTVSVEGMTFGGYTVRGSGQGYWGTWTNAAGQTVVTARGGAACCLVAP